MTLHRRPLAIGVRVAVALAVLAWGSGVAPAAHAQSMRDPTLPPAGALSAPTAEASGRAPAPDTGPVAVIVRDGKPYLVVGTRLYAAGQSLGAVRVERITETEVWLRDGKTLHKKPIFAGIVRSSVGGPPPAPECVVAVSPAPTSRRPQTAPAARKNADRVPPGENCRP